MNLYKELIAMADEVPDLSFAGFRHLWQSLGSLPFIHILPTLRHGSHAHELSSSSVEGRETYEQMKLEQDFEWLVERLTEYARGDADEKQRAAQQQQSQPLLSDTPPPQPNLPRCAYTIFILYTLHSTQLLPRRSRITLPQQSWSVLANLLEVMSAQSSTLHAAHAYIKLMQVGAFKYAVLPRYIDDMQLNWREDAETKPLDFEEEEEEEETMRAAHPRTRFDDSRWLRSFRTSFSDLASHQSNAYSSLPPYLAPPPPHLDHTRTPIPELVQMAESEAKAAIYKQSFEGVQEEIEPFMNVLDTGKRKQRDEEILAEMRRRKTTTTETSSSPPPPPLERAHIKLEQLATTTAATSTSTTTSASAQLPLAAASSSLPSPPPAPSSLLPYEFNPLPSLPARNSDKPTPAVSTPTVNAIPVVRNETLFLPSVRTLLADLELRTREQSQQPDVEDMSDDGDADDEMEEDHSNEEDRRFAEALKRMLAESDPAALLESSLLSPLDLLVKPRPRFHPPPPNPRVTSCAKPAESAPSIPWQLRLDGREIDREQAEYEDSDDSDLDQQRIWPMQLHRSATPSSPHAPISHDTFIHQLESVRQEHTRFVDQPKVTHRSELGKAASALLQQAAKRTAQFLQQPPVAVGVAGFAESARRAKVYANTQANAVANAKKQRLKSRAAPPLLSPTTLHLEYFREKAQELRDRPLKPPTPAISNTEGMMDELKEDAAASSRTIDAKSSLARYRTSTTTELEEEQKEMTGQDAAAAAPPVRQSSTIVGEGLADLVTSHFVSSILRTPSTSGPASAPERAISSFSLDPSAATSTDERKESAAPTPRQRGAAPSAQASRAAAVARMAEKKKRAHLIRSNSSAGAISRTSSITGTAAAAAVAAPSTSSAAKPPRAPRKRKADVDELLTSAPEVNEAMQTLQAAMAQRSDSDEEGEHTTEPKKPAAKKRGRKSAAEKSAKSRSSEASYEYALSATTNDGIFNALSGIMLDIAPQPIDSITIPAGVSSSSSFSALPPSRLPASTLNRKASKKPPKPRAKKKQPATESLAAADEEMPSASDEVSLPVPVISTSSITLSRVHFAAEVANASSLSSSSNTPIPILPHITAASVADAASAPPLQVVHDSDDSSDFDIDFQSAAESDVEAENDRLASEPTQLEGFSSFRSARAEAIGVKKKRARVKKNPTPSAAVSGRTKKSRVMTKQQDVVAARLKLDAEYRESQLTLERAMMADVDDE